MELLLISVFSLLLVVVSKVRHATLKLKRTVSSTKSVLVVQKTLVAKSKSCVETIV